ncbi:MAG TPA: hypothetical protein VF126_06855 [Acidobacteriaceae bacterium]
MPVRPFEQKESIYLWGLSGALVVLASFIFFIHQPIGPEYWSMPRDDFYYYLKIAHNLAHGRGSTFNGLVPTNGYHPLYFLLIAALCRTTDSLNHILTAVWMFATAMTVVTYQLVYWILRRFSSRVPVCAAAALFIAVASLDLFRDGMEITLALPLAFAFILLLVREAVWTPARCFAASLIAATMVLARLDTALLVMAIAVLLFFSRAAALAVTWRKVVAVAAGQLPVAVYLAINIVHFHTLLPISGEAKELRISPGFSSRTFASALSLSIHEHRHFVPAVLTVIGLLLFPLAVRQSFTARRVAVLAMLLLPWQQLVALSFLSDWFLWSWYLYTYNIAACAVLCLALAAAESRPIRWPTRAVVVCSLLVAVLESGQMLRNRASEDLPNVSNGLRLVEFTKTHPGIYAMGDLAGAAGYLLPYPMVQTEGLVMDRTFLEKVRRQEDLISVLRSYGVRYYIASVDFKSDGPCFDAIEPRRAGATSAHMRATLCGKPVLQYDVSYWRTRIYDLDALPR